MQSSRAATREDLYDRAYFECRRIRRRQLPEGAGFAGFRVQEAGTARSTGGKTTGWPFWARPISAPSASCGQVWPVGARRRARRRGSTIAGGVSRLHRILLRPARRRPTVRVYALLEGPSIVGAYRFLMTRDKGVVMDIEARCSCATTSRASASRRSPRCTGFRRPKKPTAIDWRPEVHDSDGLAMWTGRGERMWRPLNNPPRSWSRPSATTIRAASACCSATAISTIISTACIYDRRPSLWVEPLERRLGQGRDPAHRDPDRRRDPRQHRRHVGAGGAGAPGADPSIFLSAALARGRALSDQARRAASRPGSATAASPACRGRRACASSWWSSWAAPRPTPLRGEARAGVVGLARQHSPTSSPKPYLTMCPAIGGRSST